MPKAIKISTTPPARKGSSRAAVNMAAKAAKLSFEPMSAEVVKALPTREVFMTSAGDAFSAIFIGAQMLTKTPTELVTALRAIDDGEGTETLELIGEVEGTRAWFANYASVLEVLHARLIVCASRMVMDGGA